jgi:hypothetical protein
MFRQDRQRQVGREWGIRLGQTKTNRFCIDDLDGNRSPEVRHRLGSWKTRVLEKAYREKYITGSNRSTVMPLGIRPEKEGVFQSIATHRPALCQRWLRYSASVYPNQPLEHEHAHRRFRRRLGEQRIERLDTAYDPLAERSSLDLSGLS